MRGPQALVVATLLGPALALAGVGPLAASSCGRRPLPAGWWQPRVIHPALVRVADGDTFRAGRETFRLRGVDTPELREPQGLAARRRLAELLRGGAIHVVPRAEDVYCRTVADVYVNGHNVADVLRREGLVKPRPPR